MARTSRSTRAFSRPTFEHADGWKYGDNFMFVDKIFYNGKDDGNAGSNTYYGNSARGCRSANLDQN
jgi:nucleoside-specific outer membrane channel protein Tsx